MPRWRQVIDKETGKSQFVPIGPGHNFDEAPAIHAGFEPFTSPIDGTVISGRKAYREHMEKHGVVPAAEFSKEHYENARKERERVMNGNWNAAERQARREELHRIITWHEDKCR